MTNWDKLYIEICYLCLQINRETEMAVWFEMIGHVSWTQIEIAKSKSDHGNTITSNSITHLGENKKIETLERMTEIRNRLKNILISRAIDYDDLNVVEYEQIVREYEL